MQVGGRSANTRFYSPANMVATKNLVSHILSERRYRAIFLVTATAFAIFYMFATAIFFYTPDPIPEFVPVPHSTVIWPGGITDIIYYQTPWFIAYVNEHLIFRMSSHALVSTSVLSLLIGVNTSLFVYSLKTGKKVLDCRCNSEMGMNGRSRSISLTTFAGAIPASFATFACHGAILLPLLGLSVLSAYSNLFVAASVGSLAFGLLWTSHSIRKGSHSLPMDNF